jgi:hypothetical protein
MAVKLLALRVGSALDPEMFSGTTFSYRMTKREGRGAD